VKSGLEAARRQPLVEQRPGYIDVAPKRLYGMTSQEKTIKHGCLSLRSERIEVIFGLQVPHKRTT
jgi:hypothetical protein